MTYRFGHFELSPDGYQLRRGDERVRLEPRVFEVVAYLVAHRDRVVSKEELISELWSERAVSDSAISRVVRDARRALGDSGAKDGWIQTVHGRGFRFVGEVREEPSLDASRSGPVEDSRGEASPLTAAQPRLGPGPEPPCEGRPETSVRRRLLMVAALVGVVGAALVFAFVVLPDRAEVPQAPQAPVQRTLEAGNQLYPTLSPDGSQVAYAADRDGDQLEIFVVALQDPAAPRQLTAGGPNTEPAWSPDGGWIAYRNLARGGLWVVPSTGGEPRQLTEFGGQPAWSPDSSMIAFARPGRPTAGAAEWPASYGSAIWVVDVGSGEIRRLTAPGMVTGGHGQPAFTADGSAVVFAAVAHYGSGEVWRVPVAGGEPRRIALVAGGPPGERVVWQDPTPLPDGSGFLVLRVGWDHRLLKMPWTGGKGSVVLAPAPPGAVDFDLARNGRLVAFAVQRNQTSIEQVRLTSELTVAADPEPLVTPTTRRVWHAQWSPDGRHLLFFRSRPGSATEVVVTDDAGGEVLVVPRIGQQVTWLSPSELALDPLGDALHVDLTTGRRWSEPPLSEAAGAFATAYPRLALVRADLGAIAFSRLGPRGCDLVLWERESGETRQLTDIDGMVDYPSWSRDGRWVVFQRLLESLPENTELWRIASAGGSPERFVTGRGLSWGARFSPDGERVTYAALRAGRWYLAVAGLGEPERLLDVPPETAGYLRWPDWSPDGERIVYERMHFQTNVWTLDLGPADAAD